MPRKSRKKGPLNYYHIIIRGNNKQDIFFDEMDRKKFIEELEKTKEKYNYCLYAYVLMPNHVHLCIKDNKSAISKIMHSLLVRYVEYFNKKYERIGYLFQDRFKSVPIENYEYLKYVIRYIHLNPEKAGIIEHRQYRWSSYSEYLLTKNILIDKEEILELFSNDLLIFQEFHIEKIDRAQRKKFASYEIKTRIEDDELYEILTDIYSKEEIQNLSRLNKVNVKPYLIDILGIEGCNMKQISRVTGINIGVIKQVKSELNDKK